MESERLAELEAKVAELAAEVRRLREGFRIVGAVALEAGERPHERASLLAAASGR